MSAPPNTIAIYTADDGNRVAAEQGGANRLEFDVGQRNLEVALEVSAAGIAFGIPKSNGAIDRERRQQVIALCWGCKDHSGRGRRRVSFRGSRNRLEDEFPVTDAGGVTGMRRLLD